MWAAVLLAATGCYLLKLAGMSVPRRLLEDPRVQRVAAVLPIGLLAALAATQTFADGRHLTVDARVAGVAVALAAIWDACPSWWSWASPPPPPPCCASSPADACEAVPPA